MDLTINDFMVEAAKFLGGGAAGVFGGMWLN
jgi:hypothetical protein